MIWIKFWARLQGRSQLSNPSDLPCYHYCYYYHHHYYFHDVPFLWMRRVYVIQLTCGCCPTFMGDLCTNSHDSACVIKTCLGWHAFSGARYWGFVSPKLHVSIYTWYRNQQHWWWFHKMVWRQPHLYDLEIPLPGKTVNILRHCPKYLAKIWRGPKARVSVERLHGESGHPGLIKTGPIVLIF